MSPEGGISRSAIEDDQRSPISRAEFRRGSGDILEHAIVRETSASTKSVTPTSSSTGETRPTQSPHTSPKSADADLVTNFGSTTDRVVTEIENEELETSDTLCSPGPSKQRSCQNVLSQFCEDCLYSLDRDDLRSLSIFLCHQLVSNLSFTGSKAAEYAAAMVGKTNRTIRQWQLDLIANDGVLPESKQGSYQRSGVLWQSEELNMKARDYVRLNAAVKGRQNLTASTFCRWVNESLLPNSTLEPGFPRKVGVETSRKWLHHLGFEILSVSKGIFIDGHERDDVVEARQLFLCKMTKIVFLHFTTAPTPEAANALPSDIDPQIAERRSKTVVFFHDESTFMSNEDQSTQSGEKGEKMLFDQKARELVSWYRISSMNTPASLLFLTMNMIQSKCLILIFASTQESS